MDNFSFDDLVSIGEASVKRDRENALAKYKPYPKQLEFFEAGKKHRQRMLRAGNRNGKSYTGAAEFVYHMTGKYPDWWPGYRFNRPIKAWLSSETAELTRDGIQNIMFGDVVPNGEYGFTMEGQLPAQALADGKDSIKKASTPAGSIDFFQVKSIHGGVSTATFKNYRMAREAWQSAKLDLVWFDEEPPVEIYDEGITRTRDQRGLVLVTFTPLKGATAVVDRFMTGTPGTHEVVMTAYDCPHLDAAEWEAELKATAPHMIPSRIYGIPASGAGAVYPVPEEDVVVPRHSVKAGPRWQFIGGLDFGWDHPTAAVLLALDPDTGCVYVMRDYKKTKATPSRHVENLKHWGGNSLAEQWLPWAWGKEALQTDKGSGEPLRDQYVDAGLKMVHEHAQFDDKSVSVEAGITLILTLMNEGLFKVLDSCEEWLAEFRSYSRRGVRENDRDAKGELRDTTGGEIIKRKDDLMDATRYGAVMLRRGFGRTAGFNQKPRVDRLVTDGYDGSSSQRVEVLSTQDFSF